MIVEFQLFLEDKKMQRDLNWFTQLGKYTPSSMTCETNFPALLKAEPWKEHW